MLSRTKRAIKAFLQSEAQIQWPKPGFRLTEEPHFLFIITPSFSGSTALAQILNSSHGSAFLTERAEGQWLVPGMCADDRWHRDKVIDWDSVRACWFERIDLIGALVQNLDIVIEKSPPHLVRVDQLVQAFPRHSLLAFNRDPYANCSSHLYRMYDTAALTPEERLATLRRLAGYWLSNSRWIRRWIETFPFVHFTYEDFCAAPADCMTRLTSTIPALAGIDVTRRIKVKDYDAQGIVNYNPRQIDRLSASDIAAITEVIAPEQELLESFGYTLR